MITNVKVTEAIAYDCGYRAGQEERATEMKALRAENERLARLLSKAAAHLYDMVGSLDRAEAQIIALIDGHTANARADGDIMAYQACEIDALTIDIAEATARLIEAHHKLTEQDAELRALRAGVAELEDAIKHALYTHETSGTIAPSSVKKMRDALLAERAKGGAA
jgi:uncharacterized protein YdcH (DUF465 family)